jgi:hypothetical protein
MIEEYLRLLARHLDERGVRGRDARRFLMETREHLVDAAAAGGDAAAVDTFGEPGELAASVAAEVATRRTTGATYLSFATLAVAGSAYTALYLALALGLGTSVDVFAGSVPGLGQVTIAATLLLPQVAFVCGVLALARALRHRGEAVVATQELGVQRRRIAAALISGAGTFAALAVFAIDFRGPLPGWWVAAALAASAALTVLLVLSGVAVRRSTHAVAFDSGHSPEGVVADLEDLFGRIQVVRGVRVPNDPRRLALTVAVLAAFAVALPGAVAGDPFDGIFRASLEGVAVLACYRMLRRRR